MEEFEDNKLQVTLELEAYERERSWKVVEQMKDQQAVQININDEEHPVVEPNTMKEYHPESQMHQPKTQLEQPVEQAPMQ